MSIKIENVTKTYGSFTALNNINLEIKSGELLALLGPSGSGKTTLLRIIAGLEIADKGSIFFDGQDITSVNIKERKVGFVFQHYALFSHMTIFDNIAYGLRVRPRKMRPSKQEIHDKVHELLRLVKLEGLQDRYPSQLSGGQRQRVALARALAVDPKVLLLDEPFGALDAKVRKDLRKWLRKLHDEVNITSVFVTHDQEEALDVADRIVVMNEGKIEQIGTPDEVYENPNSPFVYDFLGNVNIFKGRLHKGKMNVGNYEFHAPEYNDRIDTEAVGYARPHQMEIKRTLDEDNKNAIQATVTYIHAVGPLVFIELIRVDNGETIEVEMIKEQFEQLNLQKEEIVYVIPKNLKVFIPQDFTI